MSIKLAVYGVIVLVIVGAFAALSITYNAKITQLNTSIADYEQDISHLTTQLANANAVISASNALVEAERRNAADRDAQHAVNTETLKQRHERMLRELEQSLATDGSCENTLRLIHAAQLDFVQSPR